jgi:hypothetical protein
MTPAASVPELRLCQDCKYARHMAVRTLDQAWYCTHDSARYQPPRSLVTGDTPAAYPLTCSVCRWDRDRCGPKGRYWTAIPLAAEIAA